mmetsp:Transcript_11046/g.16781  ORF Transcript_11046/g.16781 Transcript_11046/m.16781 type:complete len:85 (-) Transcript_11046:882-1136(-)|eukprot:CAMPEP_0170509318 /NCGR_PEP_ID=MMETSP0208-20121228/65094_1 /TAXON_ID=197538 /ORGANISM="Strombidium inclinatum, Strain S3" /LENGTH=84 /DNA_ID=CAMNT_0010792659 /DNA_START=673 /DNA_END=927 /DNA_ORIENTATION=+
MESSDDNDLDEKSCHFISEGYRSFYKEDPKQANLDHQAQIDQLREPLSKIFDLTPSQKKKFGYKQMALMSDTIIARSFEGLPLS